MAVEPCWLSPPEGSLWSEIVPRIGFFTHAQHAPVEIRRFATGSTAEIGVGTEKIRADITFQKMGKLVGLGAHFAADGVMFQIQIPESLHLSESLSDGEKWRALRAARFADLAWRGERLASVLNPFMRQWLAQIYLSALTYEAMHSQVELAEAGARIKEGRASS